LSQGYDEPGGLPGGGGGVQRAHDLDLRRRTPHLSAYRSARERVARASADRLRLHQRYVHAQENARVARVAIVVPAEFLRRKNRGITWGGLAQRERRGGDSKGAERSGQADHRAEPLDVLERASRWAGADARSHW